MQLPVHETLTKPISVPNEVHTLTERGRVHTSPFSLSYVPEEKIATKIAAAKRVATTQLKLAISFCYRQ